MKKEIILILILCLAVLTGCSGGNDDEPSVTDGNNVVEENNADDVSEETDEVKETDIEISYNDTITHFGESPVSLLTALTDDNWVYQTSSSTDSRSFILEFANENYPQDVEVYIKAEEKLSEPKIVDNALKDKEYSALDNMVIYGVHVDASSSDNDKYNLAFKVNGVGVGSTKEEITTKLQELSNHVNESVAEGSSFKLNTVTAKYYYNDAESSMDFTYWLDDDLNSCFGMKVRWLVG